MTTPRPQTGPWLERACAAGLLGLAALVLGACGPDCLGPAGLVSYDQTQTAVTLTVAHPAAEQAVTVRFSEKALPADATESVTLVVRPPSGSGPGGQAATLSITVDEAKPGAWLPAAVSAAAAPTELRESNIPVVIEAVITVPERPAPDAGLDRLAASVAIVHAGGEGGQRWGRVEGVGAGLLETYDNNGGPSTRNLVAHPLDACPVSGPCTATLRLIAWTTDRRPATATPPVIEWSIDLVGAPPGTTIRFGGPREDRPLPWALLVGGAVVAGTLLILAMGLRRRRRPRRAAA